MIVHKINTFISYCDNPLESRSVAYVNRYFLSVLHKRKSVHLFRNPRTWGICSRENERYQYDILGSTSSTKKVNPNLYSGPEYFEGPKTIIVDFKL